MSNQKHYVTFYSPGSFVSESTGKEIDAWSVDLAVRMAKDKDTLIGWTN